MARYPAKGGKEFTKAPEGTHLAVCTLIADVGLQPGSGAFPDPKVRVFFRFEIPSERITYEKDGQEVEGPTIIYHNYAASMNAKANMRKGIESWRGAKFTDAEAEQFDIRKLLGQTCLLQIVHTADGQYANVSNIMAPPKGTAKLKPEGTPVYFGPDDDSQYDVLPKFLQKKWDEQLNPTKPATSTPTTRQNNGRANSPTTNPEDAFADGEAARQGAKRADKGADPDDEIPF